MELTSGLLSRAEYHRAVDQMIGFLRSEGVTEVLVAYGFGCDCPDEQLYEDVRMPLARLATYIAESQARDYYRMGRDNLHVRDGAGRIEVLFCHESDIHLVGEDAALVARLKAAWLGEGWCQVFPHLGTEWGALGDPGGRA